MGCSISKDVDSPSKQDTSSASPCGHLSRKKSLVAVHDDQSSKMTSVAAIFSTDNGCLNESAYHAQSSNKTLSQGRYPCRRMKVDAQLNTQLDGKMLSEVVLGLPVISTESIAELAAVQKTNDRTKDDFETVNILELMEGLAEEEVKSTFQALYGNHGSSTGSALVTETQVDDAVAAKNKVTRRERPKSFSSVKSVADHEMEVIPRRSKTPPPPWERSLSKVRPDDEQSCTLLCAQATISALSGNLILSEGTNIDTNRPTSEEDGPSMASQVVTKSLESCSSRQPDNLQRALSFKYMFNDVAPERLESLACGSTSSGCHIMEDKARIGSNDSLILLTNGSEVHSDPSSPEFSAAASLKDWLPSDATPNPTLSDAVKGCLGRSILEASQNVAMQTRVPHLVPSSRKVQPKYFGSISCDSQVDTEALSMERKSFDTPMFDPELLDSFEKAMKHLSKEEWDAVRVMEDSPRNFLHLIKTLQKSSSSSTHQPTIGTNTNKVNTESPLQIGHTVPSTRPKTNDSKSKKSPSPEKRMPIARHNSWIVRKANVKQTTREMEQKVSLVFYSTTTQGDGRLFEDCNQVRGILRSIVRAAFEERSVSECLEHEQELMHALDVPAAVVPTLYVRGAYVVGIDSIMQLYKKGMLHSMLKDNVKASTGCLCRGGKFLICPHCKGRRKLSGHGEGTLLCRHCSGTGLTKCPGCSSAR